MMQGNHSSWLGRGALSLALILAAAWVGGDAWAAPAKKKAAAPAKKVEKKDEAKKPAKKAEGDAAAEETASGDGKELAGPKKDEIRTTGPAKLRRPVSEKDFDKSEAADKKRDEQIDAIKKILSGQNDPATKAELTFRLAELYWEKSKFIEGQEMAEYDRIIEEWINTGRKGEEPVVSHKRSDVYKKQALANYEIILEKYPDYPRRDEVLYIMAYNTYEAGKKDKAVKHYWELIKQYPQSAYVADSYLAMGEHYFAANDVLKAKKAFMKALETKKHKVYSFALYKLAWCDFNLQEYDAAITKFKKVITYSNEQVAKNPKDRDNIQLKSEALNDVTLTFTHVEAVETAYDYIKKEGGDKKARSLTAKLAGLYVDQGKYEQAIQTYRLLINQYPDDPDCPDFQSSIVSAYFKLNKRDEIRTEVKRLVDLYRPGTPWWKKNEKNARVVQRARETAEERMRELVTDTHQVYTKLKKQDDAELARDMYSDYLKVFPDSEHAYRLRFFYGEILWDLGDWAKAAEQYDTTVEVDKANKYKGEYTRTAAYNSILAYEKIVRGEEGRFKYGAKGPKEQGKNVQRKEGEVGGLQASAKTIDRSKKNEEQDIPAAEVKLATACDKYVNVVPVSEKATKELTDELVLVKFKAGSIYQKYFHFEEAARRFEELIDRWPAHEFARNGADLILDSWDYRQNWTELNRVGRKFQKNKMLMTDAKFASKVDKFVEGSSFKEVMVLYEKANKLVEERKEDEAKPLFADCAARFLGFQQEFPDSQFADKAVYNSTVIFDRADQLDLAINAADLLLKKYEKSELAERAVLFLGSFYERIADFRKSAEFYEQYVAKYPKREKSADALYNAAVFYQGLGERKRAVELYGKYIKDYKEQPDVPDVYWKIAKMYDDDGDFKRAGTLYGEFEKQFPKAPGNRIIESRYNHILTLLQDKKRTGEVKTQCEDMLKRYAKLKDDLKKDLVVQKAAAHCHFWLLEPKFEEFMTIKLELPMKKFKENLEKKAVKLAQLKDEYTTVLGYGDGGWGVAALHRVGVIHYEFAKALKESPDPPGLNIDQLDIYRTELEGQTFPVDEKAIEALERALTKAFELGIYTDWTFKAQELLKVYKPNEYPPAKTMPFFYSDFYLKTPAQAASGGK
jgi:tetratricopeptide (TPR) repeat protein